MGPGFVRMDLAVVSVFSVSMCSMSVFSMAMPWGPEDEDSEDGWLLVTELIARIGGSLEKPEGL